MMTYCDVPTQWDWVQTKGKSNPLHHGQKRLFEASIRETPNNLVNGTGSCFDSPHCNVELSACQSSYYWASWPTLWEEAQERRRVSLTKSSLAEGIQKSQFKQANIRKSMVWERGKKKCGDPNIVLYSTVSKRHLSGPNLQRKFHQHGFLTRNSNFSSNAKNRDWHSIYSINANTTEATSKTWTSFFQEAFPDYIDSQKKSFSDPYNTYTPTMIINCFCCSLIILCIDAYLPNLSPKSLKFRDWAIIYLE